MPWRRRRSPPPVILPSLDRLSGLIERVVELVDAVAVTPVPSPEPVPEPPREGEHDVAPAAVLERPPTGWLLFLATPDGYRTVEREGAPPERGAVVEVDGEILRVLRLGPSPFPRDRRRCAYVEGEEPAAEERTLDA